jgi:predicted amidohydrolase YtcJ
MKNIIFLTAFALLINCSSKKTPADLIIFNGNIYTGNASSSTVEAVVVHADTITFVGSQADAFQFKGDGTKLIDLQGKTMTSGFIEGHGHFIGLGFNEMNLDLMGVKSFDEIVNRVREVAAKAKPGDWIIGRGWHQDKWDAKPADMVKGFPVHDKLSAVSPNNPIVLSHASGHLTLVNKKAMDIAGVSNLSKATLEKLTVDGGEIITDTYGKPTGIFNEEAQAIIEKYITKPSNETLLKAVALASEACSRNGITSFHDAGENQKAIDVLKKLKTDNKLNVRLYIMLSGSDRSLIKKWISRGPEIDPNHWITIRSIKMYGDGALGSRGAWLLHEYSDRPGHFGQEIEPMDTILAGARLGLQHGFQVCTHAIGDRANREVLNRYEIAFKENPEKAKDVRFRIEHAQHIDPQDIPRFGQLGVIPAMQAIHLSSDRPWAIDRLGEKRIKEGAYMWKALLKSGARIMNGTDVPVEPINPIAGFYASVTRRTLKGEPMGGYEPAQKMSREEALKSYTLNAAYGAFEEKIKGTIEAGKLADFTVFSQDIMKVDENKLLSTKVIYTIVGGRIVYERK